MSAERNIEVIKRAAREVLDADLDLDLDSFLLMVGMKVGLDTRWDDVQTALGEISTEDRAK